VQISVAWPCNYVDERGDDRPTVFYHYIETSETVLGVCFGKGNISKRIQKHSYEYESKARHGRQTQSQKGQDIVQLSYSKYSFKF